MFAKYAVEGFLVQQSKELVHLFAIDARRESRQFGEAPVQVASCNVRIVALVHLKGCDAPLHKAAVVVCGEDMLCGRVDEVGHQSVPHQMATRFGFKQRVQGRRGVNKGMFPQVELVTHSACAGY